MSQPIKLHGYDQDFKSKSDAIRFLLNENVPTKKIRQKLNCSHQHIHIAKKGITKNIKSK